MHSRGEPRWKAGDLWQVHGSRLVLHLLEYEAPFQGVVVTLTTEGGTRREVTGKDGYYRFSGLEPGEVYRLHFEYPEYPAGGTSALQQGPAAGCARKDAIVQTGAGTEGPVVPLDRFDSRTVRVPVPRVTPRSNKTHLGVLVTDPAGKGLYGVEVKVLSGALGYTNASGYVDLEVERCAVGRIRLEYFRPKQSDNKPDVRYATERVFTTGEGLSRMVVQFGAPLRDRGMWQPRW